MRLDNHLSGFTQKQVELSFGRILASKNICGEVLAKNAKLSSFWSECTDDLVLQLCTYAVKQDLESREVSVTFKMPGSWWQHFKHDWFPDWLLERFPVIETTHVEVVRFEAASWYPYATLKIDNLGEPVIKTTAFQKYNPDEPNP